MGITSRKIEAHDYLDIAITLGYMGVDEVWEILW